MDIELRDVSFAVRERRILDGVTATFPARHLTCLLGANGTGKTTLLRLLAGEARPTSGRILVAGQDVTDLPAGALARHFAIVPQGVPDPPYLSVLDLVRLGRFRTGRMPWRRGDGDDGAAVVRYLRLCNVEDMGHRAVSSLSGGEKQRAWLAFALAQEKPFVLLDEALEALDFVSRRRFFRLLTDTVAKERGVVLTTHDLGLVRDSRIETIVLGGGRVRHAGPLGEDVASLMAGGAGA